MRYVIRRVEEGDLTLLRTWRARPHVVRWWGVPDGESEADRLREPRVAMWLAEARSRPFAFIQDYDVRDWSPHHFDDLPARSRGLDLYIGKADMLGIGHGSRLLRQHVDDLFARGAPAVGIDPHPENGAAIRAFGKAGFSVTGGPLDTRWGRVILMVREAASSRARRDGDRASRPDAELREAEGS